MSEPAIEAPHGVAYWLGDSSAPRALSVSERHEAVVSLEQSLVDQRKWMREQVEEARRYIAEFEADPEKMKLLEKFTRPDGTLCEHWWEPSLREAKK